MLMAAGYDSSPRHRGALRATAVRGGDGGAELLVGAELLLDRLDDEVLRNLLDLLAE
jgi:hypothetical protein